MSDDAKLYQLIDAYFDRFYKQFSTTATIMGIYEFDYALDDLSAAGINSFLDFITDCKSKLQFLDLSNLGEDARTDLKLFVSNLEANKRNFGRLQTWKSNPQIYIEVVNFGLYFLLTRDTYDKPTKVKNLTSRLHAIPHLLEMAKENLDATRCPRPYVEAAMESINGGLDILTKLVPSYIAGVSTGQDLELVLATAVTGWTEFGKYLKNDLLPKACGEISIGKSEANHFLSNDHMLSYTVDEVYEIGLSTYREIENKMNELANQIDPSKSWNDILNHAQASFTLSNGQLLALYQSEFCELTGFIKKNDLVNIPQECDLEVVKTPDFKKSTTPFASLFSPAPFDQDQKGIMLLTMKDSEKELSWHFAHKLVGLHEGVPGHYLQRVKQHTNKNISRYRHMLCGFGLFVERKQPKLNLFEEGWAVYWETQLVEEGYITDPVLVLLGLKYQLWRAARMIVDAGLHSGEMSFDECMQFLQDKLGHSKDAAYKEMRYHAMTLTQAMSYMLGKLEIEKLKKKALKVMSKREFHEAVLSQGAIPFSLLEELILPKVR